MHTISILTTIFGDHKFTTDNLFYTLNISMEEVHFKTYFLIQRD